MLLPNFPRVQPINALIMHLSFSCISRSRDHSKINTISSHKSTLNFFVIGVTGCVIGIAFISTSDDFQSNINLWTNLGWTIVVFNFMLVLGSLVLSLISIIEMMKMAVYLVRVYLSWKGSQSYSNQVK